jgi:hypothetical protein
MESMSFLSSGFIKTGYTYSTKSNESLMIAKQYWDIKKNPQIASHGNIILIFYMF